MVIILYTLLLISLLPINCIIVWLYEDNVVRGQRIVKSTNCSQISCEHGELHEAKKIECSKPLVNNNLT